MLDGPSDSIIFAVQLLLSAGDLLVAGAALFTAIICGQRHLKPGAAWLLAAGCGGLFLLGALQLVADRGLELYSKGQEVVFGFDVITTVLNLLMFATIGLALFIMRPTPKAEARHG